MILSTLLLGTPDARPILPESPRALLEMAFYQMLVFSLFFGAAWMSSRASPVQLGFAWNGGLRPVWRGFWYAIGLRLAVAAVMTVLALLVAQVTGSNVTTSEWLRPKTENLVSFQALLDDPLYVVVNMTVTSFVLGGFREELWRSGMLLGLIMLLPNRFATEMGKVKAVAVIALLFGFAHYIQGWSAVLMTSLLGFLLGLLIVKYRSIWEAVLAHGFFDATSFAALYAIAKYAPTLLN